MVTLTFIVGSIIVPLVVSTLVSVGLLGYAYRKRLEPLILEAQEFFTNAQARIDEADKAIKTGMSAMGEKSGKVRNENNLQKAIGTDILNSQAPELKIILEMLSPDTLEMIEDNPDAALSLISRYGPRFGIGQQQEQTQGQYDL